MLPRFSLGLSHHIKGYYRECANTYRIIIPTFTPDTYGVRINDETQGGEAARFSLWRHYGLPIQTGYVVLITDGVASPSPGRISPSVTDMAGADTGSGDDGRGVFSRGATYTVTDAEDTILTTAGYTVT